MNAKTLLDKFVKQSLTQDLKTSDYPKDWSGFGLRVSFGMGMPARVPWIAFLAPEMSVSNGYYPVYLYYKDLNTLVLSYGVSETNESLETWPMDITNNLETIKAYFDTSIPRYGDSYVFKVYEVKVNKEVEYINKKDGKSITEKDIESDLEQILDYYQQVTAFESYNPKSTIGQGIFYMEKQLEDFIIQNWANTDLGKKYDLIIEEGVNVSQQYKTDIGPIDILAKDKVNGSHVVIELKKNQTSDDTIGQIARYMGWVQEEMNDQDVKGIIIAKEYDKKLNYALKRVSDIEVYIYEVDFRLKEFKV